LQEYRVKQEEIQTKLNGLQKADEDYYLTAEYILKLANKAADIFKSSEPKLKQQILKLVVQNCSVDDVSLSYTYRKPFDMFAEGSLRHNWLPVIDAFRTKKVNLTEIQNQLTHLKIAV